MLNVKPSEKQGRGGSGGLRRASPTPGESLMSFFKAGCGSVNGHGWCLSCFLWQIIHGTIREWHLSGSKLFVFVSMWHSFSALKFIWYQFVVFLVGTARSTVCVAQNVRPPRRAGRRRTLCFEPKTFLSLTFTGSPSCPSSHSSSGFYIWMTSYLQRHHSMVSKNEKIHKTNTFHSASS